MPWRARKRLGSKDRIVFFGLSVREDAACRNKENKCSELKSMMPLRFCPIL